MEQKKLLKELIDEIEEVLMKRGQSPNAVAQYHYIYQVFLAYSNSCHQEHFSKETLERCLSEHYGITDEKTLSRRQHYKKKVLRAFRLLSDRADGKPFADRYTDAVRTLKTQEYMDAITAFSLEYQKSGRQPKTLDCYQRYAGQFLEFAEENDVFSLNGISTELISRFTLTLSGYRKCTVKGTLGALRIFLYFLYVREYTKQDFSKSVAGIKVRTQTKIPSVWSKNEVLKLLDSIDRANPSGKRDYAILLLVTRLGLRVGDINNLKFENIDWRKNSIEFIQGKTGTLVRLPLLKDVGWAMIDYVQNGRPGIESPYLFLTHNPPFKKYADENHLHATIKKYMIVAGIQGQSNQKRGMHSLRHTLANRLLENHESVHTISSALGHSSPDSVSVYLKTDIERLRECSLIPSEVGL